jgi:glycerophosphoryl diester phosphodiesterase
LDFGSHYSDKFAGLQISTFEEILQKFAGRVIMNIHIKPLSPDYNEEYLKKIVALVRKYDCEKHVYFMLEHDHIIKKFKEEFAPDIAVCVGHDFNRPYAIVDRAIELHADKVQLFKPYFTQEMIDKAKEHGIICNVFWSDDVEEAKKFLSMGIDTILTNDYLKISNGLKIK